MPPVQWTQERVGQAFHENTISYTIFVINYLHHHHLDPVTFSSMLLTLIHTHRTFPVVEAVVEVYLLKYYIIIFML